MIKLLTLIVLAQSSGATAKPDSTELYVPTDLAVRRCVDNAADPEFREKLRDLLDVIENAHADNLFAAHRVHASMTIREFLIHQNYETAVRMLIAVKKTCGAKENRATVALTAILRATDLSWYNVYGPFKGYKLDKKVYTTIRLPQMAISAMDSDPVLKELHRLYPDAEDIPELFEQIERKYDGHIRPSADPVELSQRTAA